jgi:hypothetical protein
MGSTSRCWKNDCNRRLSLSLQRWLTCVVAICLALGIHLAPTPALAQTASPPSNQSIDLLNAALSLSPDGGAWVVTADFKLSLSPAVEEAVNRGLALYFITEFELIRPRWYWRDERAVAGQINYKLSFNALTRQYRLTANGYQTTYANLQDALAVISRLRGWRVAEADRIKKNDAYEAWLRLRLDTSQLPKPFQVGAIANRDWNPESEWKKFPFPSETAKSAP